MPTSSPAFSFEEAVPPIVFSAARSIAATLSSGTVVSRAHITHTLCQYFGGSDAEGRWSVRDAHAALELAQVIYLQAVDAFDLTALAAEADALFASLEALVPGQANRSEEQIAWQQFATPPRLAWLAARACAFSKGDNVLEPSAGTGMLALWAEKSGAILALNEISPLRRDCLAALFPQSRLTGHDAELIDELLDAAVAPSVVLMNPPYSHGIERGHDGRTGARHLRSAWNRLTDGGRLVAIMPEWFDSPKFLASINGPVSLQLNVAIERAFVSQGTGITARLLVLDKTKATIQPVVARSNDFFETTALIDALPARAAAEARHGPSRIPTRAPFRLFASALRPLPAANKPATAPHAIMPLAYQPLETPAPIEAQVGHYLPYRPSRIVIADAAEHPTPLVESVAMGSIAAPVPHAVPQLPEGLVSKGLLSAAQVETLIYAASAHERDLQEPRVQGDRRYRPA